MYSELRNFNDILDDCISTRNNVLLSINITACTRIGIWYEVGIHGRGRKYLIKTPTYSQIIILHTDSPFLVLLAFQFNDSAGFV